MAIELKQKRYSESSGWMNILLYVSVIVLILIIGLYFLFGFLNNQAKVELNSFSTELQDNSGSEKEIKEYQQKINDFSKILSKRKNMLIFLTFFEKLTHPLVWVQDLQATNLNGGLSFSGKTENFVSLGQQFLILKSSPFVESAELSEIGIDDEKGGVIFSFDLKFNDKIFEIIEEVATTTEEVSTSTEEIINEEINE
jgi:Tfp pilus assembly protein PilN